MNSLINKALLKENFKRFWSIILFQILIYILFIVTFLYNENAGVSSNQNYIISMLQMQNSIVVISSVLAPLTCSFLVFSYLFDTKASTQTSSYPVSKNQLFFTNALSGFIMFAIPLIILTIFMLKPINYYEIPPLEDDIYYSQIIKISVEVFPKGLIHGQLINTIPIVLGFLFRALLTATFYYTVFLLAVMISSSSIVFILVSSVLTLIPVAINLFFQMVCYFYLFGYSVKSNPMQEILVSTNPVMFANIYSSEVARSSLNIDNTTMWYVLIYIVIAVLLFGLSLWLNKIRKQERTEDSIVFYPIKNLLIFAVSFFGMIIVGLFFLNTFHNLASMYVGFIIGFVIFYILSQMIAEKTFNILYKTKDFIKYFGILVVFYIFVIVFFRLDLTGYAKYSPEISEIEGIYIGDVDYYDSKYPDYFLDKILIRDENIISEVSEIHKKIIEDDGELKSIFYDEITQKYIRGRYNNTISYRNIVFKLKDGKYVVRKYFLPHSIMYELGLKDLLFNEDVILSNNYIIKSPENISKIDVEYYENENTREDVFRKTITDKDEIVSILEEVKKDYIESSIEDMNLFYMNMESRKEIENINKEKADYLSIRIFPNDNTSYRFMMQQYGFSKHENIINWMNQRGYFNNYGSFGE